ncbi:WD40 repeat-like protein [Paxillus ammoniavirescens]|nr:WD40 repeat-like protein [Paxillus ammoniavirescens]
MSRLYDATRNAYRRVRGLPQLVLLGHADRTRSVAFLPDGNQVINPGGDDSIRARGVEDGEEVGTVMKEKGLVLTVAASSDGDWIATGGRAKKVTIWNATTHEKVVEMTGHTGWVRTLAFSPDSARVASGSDDKMVIVWSTTTGKRLTGPLEGHTYAVDCVQFSPDGDRIASCDCHDLRIWYSHVGEFVIPPIQGETWSLAWTSNGHHAVEVIGIAQVPRWLCGLVMIQDSPRLADMSRFYDTAKNAYRRVRGLPIPTVVLRGHTSTITSVAFLPDGKRVISGSVGGGFRAWNLEDGDEVGTVMEKGGHICTVAASSDGQWIATGGKTDTITIRNATTYDKVIELVGHTSAVLSLSFSPDSTRVVSTSADKTVIVWSTTLGEQLAVVGPLEGRDGSSWPGDVCAQFSPDGERIATCGMDDIRIWHSQTGELIIPSIQVKSWSLAWTNGEQLLIAGYERVGAIKFLDTSTGSLLTQSNGHTNVVTSVALAHNGKFFASGSNDIRLWDTTTQQQLGPALHHDCPIFSMAISPDNRHLVSGGEDRKLRIWNLQHNLPESLLENAPTAVSVDDHAYSQQVSDPPPQEAPATRTAKDHEKDKKVPDEGESEQVGRPLQRRPSESSFLRAFLDRPAVASVGGADDTSNPLYDNFENDPLDLPPPVDEPPKKRFSKFLNKFSRKKKQDRGAETQIQPEGQLTVPGEEAEPAVDFEPAPVATPQHLTEKDKGKQHESDFDATPGEGNDHASTLSPGPESSTSEGHTRRQIRNRVSRIHQAIMQREIQEYAYVAELRDRYIFAWETGPAPDEIERGCCFHLASYICYGQRDPNINPGESNTRPIAHLGPSDHGSLRTKLRALGARLDRLLVRLHLRKPPPATAIASTTAPSPRADHNEASAPSPSPLSNRSPPTITICSPMNTTEAPVHPPASPSSSNPMPSPPAAALPSPESVDPSIDVDCAPSEMEPNPWKHTDTEGRADQASVKGMTQLDLEDPWRNP